MPNAARAKSAKLADGGTRGALLAAMPAIDCQEKGVGSVFIQKRNCPAESYGARFALSMI